MRYNLHFIKNSTWRLNLITSFSSVKWQVQEKRGGKFFLVLLIGLLPLQFKILEENLWEEERRVKTQKINKFSNLTL
jgi:hypothetical protein